MKIKKSVRYVCLGLIFAMLCGSVFFGSRSFAKYLEEYKSQQEASVASPVVVYSRYALTRTTASVPYTYPINNTDETFIVSDFQPKDELSYFFNIKSNDSVISNEVLLQVSVTFNVYMELLKKYEKEGEEVSSLVYAGFEVGKDYDSDDVRFKGSVSFFKYDGLSSDFEQYKTGVFSKPLDGDTVMSYNNDKLICNKVEKSFISGVDGSGNDVIGTTELCKNSVGFYMEPGQDVVKSYLIKVILPEQEFGTSSSDYIGARLHIELDVNAVQVQQKS